MAFQHPSEQASKPWTPPGQRYEFITTSNIPRCSTPSQQGQLDQSNKRPLIGSFGKIVPHVTSGHDLASPDERNTTEYDTRYIGSSNAFSPSAAFQVSKTPAHRRLY
eukprot:CAMPEP_0196573762 /NCGR_PEP_ID=MMETSP1081-20130531/3613_1 /TAXON_ID=36882 /ORGANISM="Pyramimonas amylifera, Strain CCMP720" /LENGTH=106 /DNA_ID=CAMNT_0041891587 /DNA_START=186 /DNA_END=506 /DNA_ORIENTATION=+